MNPYGLVINNSTLVLASVILAFLGVVGSPDSLWVWILASGCVGVVVVLVIKNHRRQTSRILVGRNYGIVLSRIVRLIADLSDLSAREFDLWVVDLYLPKKHPSRFKKGRSRDLELSLHIALTDVRSVPDKIDLSNGLFGHCYDERRPELWWDIALAPASEENHWNQLESGENEQMRTDYGVASVNPVVDNLGRNCTGLLVVHAMRDAEVVTKVLSALRHSEGRRRIAAACVDIHGHLQA